MSEEGIRKDIKVILLGDSSVGKTSIILRYYKDQFDINSLSTIGSTYVTKDLKRGNVTYVLNIWDTSGQEKYHSVTKLFIQNANIILLVYSIVSQESFNTLEYWYNSALDICDNIDKIVFAVIGNKSDLFESENCISEEDPQKFAEDKKAIFKLVSAKVDKKGLDSLFEQLLDEYIKKNPEPIIEEKSFKISQAKKEKKKGKNTCC
jgi:small GTP-binding protein